MQSVTLKNNTLVPTVWWIQILLLIMGVLLTCLALIHSYGMFLFLPLLIWFFNKNHNIYNEHLKYDLVLRTGGQWHLIQSTSHQVIEAALCDYWVATGFIAIKLKTEHNTFWYVILRRHVEQDAYSRIIVGIQRNESF